MATWRWLLTVPVQQSIRCQRPSRVRLSPMVAEKGKLLLLLLLLFFFILLARKKSVVAAGQIMGDLHCRP